MKSIELLYKVGDMYPGSIYVLCSYQYYNEDGSFTIIRNGETLILKKSLFTTYCA